MTVLWLLIWLLARSPQLEIDPLWNSWAVALAVCAFIDVVLSSRVAR